MADPLAEIKARLQEALSAEDWSVHDDEVEVTLAMQVSEALHEVVGREITVFTPDGVVTSEVADYDVEPATLTHGIGEIRVMLALRPPNDHIHIEVTEG